MNGLQLTLAHDLCRRGHVKGPGIPKTASGGCLECANAGKRRRRARLKAENPELLRQQRRAEYLKRKDAEIAAARAWQGAHPARVKELRIAWAGANRDRLREWDRRRARNDPGRQRPEYFRAWRAANHAKVRASRHKYRTAVRGTASAETVAWFMAIASDPCAYCGAPGEHDDHIVPVSEGGEHDWANVTRACAACNHSKRAKPMLLWMAERVSKPGP